MVAPLSSLGALEWLQGRFGLPLSPGVMRAVRPSDLRVYGTGALIFDMFGVRSSSLNALRSLFRRPSS